VPTLDELYGPGTADQARTGLRFGNAYGAVTLSEHPDGPYCYVSVDWANGSFLRMICSETRIHYSALRSTAPGLYSGLVNVLPPWARNHGVATFTANPGDAASETVLGTRGAWIRRRGTVGDGGMIEWAL